MRAALGAGLGAAALAFATVALVAGIGDGSEAETAAPRVPAQRTASVDHASGQALFARMGCGSCHTLAAAGSTGQFGPNLDERLPTHTRESLIARITAAPSETEDFGAMPTNFGSRMNARELGALVDFLLASAP